LELAKYLGEDTSRKEAEEKSSAFFIGLSLFDFLAEGFIATDTIWRNDARLICQRLSVPLAEDGVENVLCFSLAGRLVV
jgi:hypothetical protein